MLNVILLTILTGLLWTGVGVCLTKARRARCHVENFYVVASIAGLLGLLLWLLLRGELLPPAWSWFVCGCMVVGAVFNALSNTCTMLNLGQGNAALYFALSRMGFSLSFRWSVLVWHEDARWYNFLGIACLVCAVILTAIAKSGTNLAETQLSHRRLLLSLGSTLCSGCSQVCMVFPSSAMFASQNLPTLPPLVKTALVFSTNIVFFSIVIACRRHSAAPCPRRPLVAWALLWSLLAIGSYAALFAALHHLGPLNRAGIAFPIGGAVQIFAFALIARCCWKEKLTPLQLIALALIILGIIAVRLG